MSRPRHRKNLTYHARRVCRAAISSYNDPPSRRHSCDESRLRPAGNPLGRPGFPPRGGPRHGRERHPARRGRAAARGAAPRPRGGLARRAARQGRPSPTAASAPPRSRRRSRRWRASARIMDTYGVVRYRAVATSAVREAANRDTFLDRVRLRTGLDVEVIDGSEENRLTYLAVREALREHEALDRGDALLVEVGGGSADISFLRQGRARPLGDLRPRRRSACARTSRPGTAATSSGCASCAGTSTTSSRTSAARCRCGRRGTSSPSAATCASRRRSCWRARTCDAAPAASRARLSWLSASRSSPTTTSSWSSPITCRSPRRRPWCPRCSSTASCWSRRRRDASSCPRPRCAAGLLLDLVAAGEGPRHRGLRTAGAGARRRRSARSTATTPPTPGNVAAPRRRASSTSCAAEHGLSGRGTGCCCEVAALLHDVGIFVNLRAHHKHAQYLLSVSEIFGLGREDDMAIVANVARYHRRGLPQQVAPALHGPRPRRAGAASTSWRAILRLANALDADHLQKVRDVRVLREDEPWVLEVEGAGDLTMERLAALAARGPVHRGLRPQAGLPRGEGSGRDAEVPEAASPSSSSTASCRGSSSTAACSRRPRPPRTRCSSG